MKMSDKQKVECWSEKMYSWTCLNCGEVNDEGTNNPDGYIVTCENCDSEFEAIEKEHVFR